AAAARWTAIPLQTTVAFPLGASQGSLKATRSRNRALVYANPPPPSVADQLFQNSIEIVRQAPARVVGLQLGEVGDVTDVVALARLLDVLRLHLAAEQGLHLGDAFHQATAVRAAAAEVVDLTGTWVLGESPQRLDDVVAVDLIAHLLPLVAEDRIR